MDRMENGASSTSPSIFQLYSRYGGGKTHGMLVMPPPPPSIRISNYWEETAQTKAYQRKSGRLQRGELQPHTGNESG